MPAPRVPRAVRDGLIALHAHGTRTWFLRRKVAARAQGLGYEATATWIMDNKKEYAAGLFHGFAVDDPAADVADVVRVYTVESGEEVKE